MTLLDLAKRRRSVRRYKSEGVPLEKVLSILDTARYAPSGANQQPWLFIVVTDSKLKSGIRGKAEVIEREFHQHAPVELKAWLREHKITPEKPFLTDAPVLIVVSGDTRAPYWLESTWISIAYLILSAEEQGLGTLTYTPNDLSFLKPILHVPENYQPVAIIPVGLPKEYPAAESSSRKPLSEIVLFDKYEDKVCT